MDVLDRIGNQGHPEEDYLERYVMKKCSEPETGAIEEHLLVCEPCRARLYNAEEWVSLMKIALPLGPSRRRVARWRQALPLPQWMQSGFHFLSQPVGIGAGCAVLAVLLLSAPLLFREGPLEEEIVNLKATRGNSKATPAGDSRHLLRLRLDTADLSEPLECEIVDSGGALVWKQAISRADPEVKLNRTFKPGLYWVRINSRGGDHSTLREFRIDIG